MIIFELSCITAIITCCVTPLYALLFIQHNAGSLTFMHKLILCGV